MQTRAVACFVAIVTAALARRPAPAAQDWPSRLVRIVVPAAAGGSSDAAARLVTNHFQAVFRQPFIIENKPGNGNAMGAAFVAQAEPDGYTLLVVEFGLEPHGAAGRQECRLRSGRRLQPHRHADEFALRARGLSRSRREDARGIRRQGACAKACPTRRPIAAASAISGGEYFQRLAGISMQHVPYRGGGPAVADVIAGHVPAIFLPVTTVGRAGAQRRARRAGDFVEDAHAVLPNVPTFAESGYPELVLASWFGLSGPKKLSPDIVARINREARAFLKEPQMRKLAENDASEPLDADAAGFARYVAAEVARWGEVVRALDIKGEE